MNVGLLTLLVPLSAAPPVVAPPAGPAPVLAARVVAPDGVRVTAYPGTPFARTLDAPAAVAFRPGYVYRLALSNLPDHPGRTLYPEVEVRGTLVPRPGMRYADYPVPLRLTADDIDRVVNGAVVTKVLYLEDPEKAVPSEARPDAPIEIAADDEADAVRAAVENGRLVAILRVGDKPLAADELRATAVDGTVLLPGDTRLKAPALPPMLPWLTVPLFDPILGPKGSSEECLLDGGDRGDRLGVGPNGKLGGLEPTDVGVEFTVGGKRRVTSSNVVCICAPRFVARRSEAVPVGVRMASGPGLHFQVTGKEEVRTRDVPRAQVGRDKPAGLDATIRPAAYRSLEGVRFLIGSTRPNVIGQVDGLLVKAAVVEPEELTAYPGVCPLTVTKAVDPDGPAQGGDTLTVTIRYANTGNKPVSDVVLSDSLSGRLEYVAGSALSDRAANFATSENEAGSVVVRWELPGKVFPGQTGVVKFQVRVR